MIIYIKCFMRGLYVFQKEFKKEKKIKKRNWLAVLAHFKTGAGSHKDKKKERSKKKCRGKVKDSEK